MSRLSSVVVFCGSKSGVDPAVVDLASDLGRELAARDITVIYGGASIGVMGQIADAALAAGGRVTGVMPADLPTEITHQGLTELHRVPDMHARKKLMYELADAAVALPGGMGTLEEVFEVATWNQLGMHAAPMPIALLSASGFWDHLDAFLSGAVAAEFIHPEWRAGVRLTETVEAALSHCDQWEPAVKPLA